MIVLHPNGRQCAAITMTAQVSIELVCGREQDGGDEHAEELKTHSLANRTGGEQYHKANREHGKRRRVAVTSDIGVSQTYHANA